MKHNDHLLVGQQRTPDGDMATITGNGPIRTLSFKMGVVINIDLRRPTAITFLAMNGIQISVPYQPQITVALDMGADRDFYNLLVAAWREEYLKANP